MRLRTALNRQLAVQQALSQALFELEAVESLEDLEQVRALLRERLAYGRREIARLEDELWYPGCGWAKSHQSAGPDRA
ncbi:MAG: hypothetical protein QM714_19425 [Nocardioides sp.]|uniref:hypothetical protein n=1 Tax=Nocardioides sp. TaxID=35761 RepID=UPI0039E4D19A